MRGRALALALVCALACGCQWSQATLAVDDAGFFPLAPDDAGGAALEDAGAAAAPAAPSADPVDASSLDAGPVTLLAAGGQSTCAVTSAGGVWCWGSNAEAQLGATGCPASLVPMPVVGAGLGVTAVAAGAAHTCALAKGDGGSSVHCWGSDSHGQLGSAGAVMTATPIQVQLAAGVTAIAAGGLHTCTLAGGVVQCWGAGSNGQLGGGVASDSAAPVAVKGLSGVTAIAAGGAHTCALTSAGGVACWGLNAYGQLGDGTTTNRSTPVPVAGLSSGVTAIAAGNAHTCALLSSGGVSCWGFGLYGQLGSGAIASSATPAPVTGLSAQVAIAAGGTHTCALAKGGAVWCWGDDQSGQLGDNGGADSPVPVAVTGLAPGARAITAGTAHTCVITGAGAAQCWGWNVGGQLGNDTSTDSPTAVTVCGF